MLNDDAFENAKRRGDILISEDVALCIALASDNRNFSCWITHRHGKVDGPFRLERDKISGLVSQLLELQISTPKFV